MFSSGILEIYSFHLFFIFLLDEARISHFMYVEGIAFYFVHTFLLILYVTTGYLKCCLIYSAFISHVITWPTTLSWIGPDFM